MLFNSLAFLVFFPLVALFYWALPHKFRNYFLLAASYYFYMSWNATYGLLILLSTIVTWGSARMLQPASTVDAKGKRKNKATLWACLIINLGILFLYKYANFFIGTVNDISGGLNLGMHVPLLDLLLPVGISFYTFQAIGYTIDVYRGTIKPEKNFFTYALFVSFFPQLVAGPIERAKNLLPQFHAKHLFDGEKAMKGIQMMVWGYFMKLCIADRAALYVDAVFNNLEHHSGSSVSLASFLFTMQIYCDFCGYSLIAIGVAKVIGFDLMENFHRPYFSTNIKNFWKRWHISLSTWFMDYVYIPLGGNRCSMRRHLLNLFITFVVSGMWHGANWTFLIWGAYHGVLIVINTLWHKFGPKISYCAPLQRLVNGICTFVLVMFGWIFFRANTIGDAFEAIRKIFMEWGGLYKNITLFGYVFLSILVLFIGEFINERSSTSFSFVNKKVTTLGYLSLSLLIAFILSMGVLDGGQFIYFQF